MFFCFTKSIVSCLVLFFLSGCAVPGKVLEQKWVPYAYPGSAPSDAFAPIFVLETRETACASRANPKGCYTAWDMLPSGKYPIGQDEVQYLRDLHGKGLQRVRMSKHSHCAIMWEPEDKTSCHIYWWHFSQEKIRETT